MPAKAIPVIVAAVVATTIVIYNHREEIKELVDRTRERLARSIHEFADSIGPRQREAPYGSQSSFEDRRRREEEAEGFLRAGRDGAARASGMQTGNSVLRHRGSEHAAGAAPQATQHDQTLFDAMTNSKEIPMQNINVQNTPPSPPPPPPPPRRSPETHRDQAVPPSESGYGTEQTNFVSPAINPQPSSVARQGQEQPRRHEHTSPSEANNFIMPALAVGGAGLIAGGVVAATNSGPSENLQSNQTSFDPFSDSVEGERGGIDTRLIENPDWIQEWANNTDHEHIDTPGTLSVAGSLPEEVGDDIGDTMSEFGTASDGGFSEAGSWTEVGSETSENDH